jgi:hypothetical protein
MRDSIDTANDDNIRILDEFKFNLDELVLWVDIYPMTGVIIMTKICAVLKGIKS